MMNQLSAYIGTLGTVDYLILGGSLLLFLLFLILALLLRTKRMLSLLLIFLAFAIIILLPTLGSQKLHDVIFKHTLSINEVRKLEFSEALVVKGLFENNSTLTFNACTLTAEVYKVTGNSMLDIISPLNPFQKGSIVLEDISPGQKADFKIFVEPFTYTDEYNISTGARCR